MTVADPMPNAELLEFKGPESILTSREQQRRHVLRIEKGPFACPNCATEHTRWGLLGITNVNDYDLSVHHPDLGECQGCGRGLVYVTPFFGVPHVRLLPDPSLAKVA